MTIFMLLSSWRGHCENTPSTFDECRLGVRWSPTHRPSQPLWPVTPPLACYHPHPRSPFISITQPENWYAFYHPIPQKVEGWVDLGTAENFCRKVALFIQAGCLSCHPTNSVEALKETQVINPTCCQSSFLVQLNDSHGKEWCFTYNRHGPRFIATP